MHRRRKKEPKNSLNLAVLFLAVFLFFIVLSICFKLFFLIKDSRFDGSNSYNLEFVNSDKSYFVSFSPQDKSISILKAKKSDDVLAPIDGRINSNFNRNKLTTTLLKELFSPSSHEDINVVDLARLAIFSKTISQNSITLRDFSNFNDSKITFKDPKVVSEGKSIQIINATNVSGLGNRLATFVSNMGGNVILVESEAEDRDSEIIYFKDKSYTLSRISEFLGYKTTQSTKREVADVIIVIGKDGFKSLPF